MNKLVLGIAAGIIAVAITVAILTSVQIQNPSGQQSGQEIQATDDFSASSLNESEIGIIETAQGTIKVEFFPDAAPAHVESFVNLANEGFFDGVLFHRIVPGFVIQGGDPLSKDLSASEQWGSGGPGYTLAQEFNDIHHDRGILSMARSSDPDSAGSQFFIVLEDSELIKSSLDEKYTVFGRVIDGMDVVDRIASLQTVGGNGRDAEQPANPSEARITTIRIVEE